MLCNSLDGVVELIRKNLLIFKLVCDNFLFLHVLKCNCLLCLFICLRFLPHAHVSLFDIENEVDMVDGLYSTESQRYRHTFNNYIIYNNIILFIIVTPYTVHCKIKCKS